MGQENIWKSKSMRPVVVLWIIMAALSISMVVQDYLPVRIVFLGIILVCGWVSYDTFMRLQREESVKDEKLHVLNEAVEKVQRLNEELVSKNEEMAAIQRQASSSTRQRDLLLEMYQSLAQTLDLNQLLDTLLGRVKELVGFQSAGVFLYNADKTELSLAKSHGLHASEMASQLSSEIGIPAIVAQTRTPLLLKNAREDPRLARLQESISIESAIYYPIALNKDVFGVLCLWSPTGTYGEKDAEVLMTVTGEAARALKNAELYQDTETRLNFVMKLWETSKTLTQSMDPTDAATDRVLGEVLNGIRTVFGAQKGIVFSYRKDDRTLTPQVSCDLKTESEAELAKFANQGPLGLPFFLHNPFQVKDITRDSRFAPCVPVARSEKVTSLLWAPLMGRHSSVGALALFSERPRVWMKDEFQWLDIFSKVISIALENISLFHDLASEKHQLQVLIDNMPEGVFTTDLQGRVLTWNDAGEKITGWTHREMIGQPCSSFIKCQTVDLVWCKDRCPLNLAMGGRSRVDSGMANVAILNRDGRKVPVFLTSAPIFTEDGRVGGAILVFRDITKEKEIEQMKEDFIATITHDLKSPLASIMGYIELLLNPKLGNTNPQQQEFLEAIRRSSKTLQMLIDNILESTRMEAGKMVFNPARFTLHGLTEEIREMFVPLVAHKHLNLEFDVDPAIEAIADREKIKEVFINLCSNAVKFTRENGHVRVRAELDKANKRVRMQVADTGKGIPAGELHKLFQKFSQVKGERGGTGLGLYIVKKILEAHGDTVSVESTEGVGTTFTFTLPLFVLLKEDLPAVETADTNVLLLEMDPDKYDLMAQTVRQQGWNPIQVLTSDEALTRAVADQPRLIAMDAGFINDAEESLISRLKANDRTRHIPILLICDWQHPISEHADSHIFISQDVPIDRQEFEDKVLRLVQQNGRNANGRSKPAKLQENV